MRNKEFIGRPIHEKETKEKKGNKPRNPSWNKKEGGNHDGTQCHNTKETNPTTLPGRRWRQDMMMEQSARRLGRQTPEPYPKPKRLRKWWWNRMPGGTTLFLGRVENPIQLQSCLGNKPEPGTDDGTECQKSRETSPGTPARTKTWWWNRMPKR